MDDKRFDVWTRQVAGIGDRRAALRALAGTGVASGLFRRPAEAAALCKAAGARCAAHSECCSSDCKKSQGKKKKNGKRRKGKKTCRGNGLVLPACLAYGAERDVSAECCGSLACASFDHRCCAPSGASCSSTAECCTYGGLDVVCKAIDGPPQCCRPNGVYCYQDGQCCSGHCDGLACAN